MGRAKEFWREVVPIIARTHPVFRARVWPPERRPDRSGDDLQSEIEGLRDEVRELSEEVGRQRKVLSGVVAKVGAEDQRGTRTDA